MTVALFSKSFYGFNVKLSHCECLVLHRSMTTWSLDLHMGFGFGRFCGVLRCGPHLQSCTAATLGRWSGRFLPMNSVSTYSRSPKVDFFKPLRVING